MSSRSLLFLIPAAVGFAAALGTAPLWERRLQGRGWIDTPRAGRHAKRPVSRAGGAAWFTGLSAGMAAAVFAASGLMGGAVRLGAQHPAGGDAVGRPGLGLAAVAPSGIVVLIAALAFGLGRLDDRNRLRAGRKWILQATLLAVGTLGLLWAAGFQGGFSGIGAGRGSADPAGALFVMVVAFFAAAVLQVALQILDHLDGTLAVHAFAGAAVLALAAGPGWARDAGLAGCGASLGFLCWNRPPARLYFGNTGSLTVATVLPLLLVAVALRSVGGTGLGFSATGDAERTASVGAGDGSAASPWRFLAVLPVFAWPLLDLAVVTLARLRRGDPPWKGGCDHLAHRLARRLGSDRAAWAVVVAAAAAGFLLAAMGLR